MPSVQKLNRRKSGSSVPPMRRCCSITGRWATTYCTTRTDKAGAARSSRNWRMRYGSIIPKRKDIRSGTWLICASSHVITYSKCVKTTDKIRNLNNASFTQEALAQIQDVAQTVTTVYRMPIEDMKKCSWHHLLQESIRQTI